MILLAWEIEFGRGSVTLTPNSPITTPLAHCVLDSKRRILYDLMNSGIR